MSDQLTYYHYRSGGVARNSYSSKHSPDKSFDFSDAGRDKTIFRNKIPEPLPRQSKAISTDYTNYSRRLSSASFSENSRALKRHSSTSSVDKVQYFSNLSRRPRSRSADIEDMRNDFNARMSNDDADIRSFDRIQSYRLEKNYVTYTEQPANGFTRTYQTDGFQKSPNSNNLIKYLPSQLIPNNQHKRPIQRHQSVREPMMSIVPEEDSMLSNSLSIDIKEMESQQNQLHRHPSTKRQQEVPVYNQAQGRNIQYKQSAPKDDLVSLKGRNRTNETLSSIQTVGTITNPERVTRNGSLTRAIYSVSGTSNTLPPSYHYQSPFKETKSTVYQSNGKTTNGLSTFQPKPLPRSQSYNGNSLYRPENYNRPVGEPPMPPNPKWNLQMTSIQDENGHHENKVQQLNGENPSMRNGGQDYNTLPKIGSLKREEGDGAVLPEEFSSTGDKSNPTNMSQFQSNQMDPPELPPRDYENVGSYTKNQAIISPEECNEKQGFDDNTFATIYKVSSKSDLCAVETIEKDEKNGLIFHETEEPCPPYSKERSPMKQWFNGWNQQQQQQQSAKMDDKQSTLSRYWTMDRSLQRRLQKTNYQHIKRLCRDRGTLFEDPDFPPINKSIYSSKKPPLHPIVWLRPHEICQRPRFIAEGTTRFDVEQGEAGDPWLLAAVSSLTLTPKFLDRVVPPDQNFEHGYCGVFRFRFWHFGDWVEVLVDDRLPTFKGRLVYLHSTDPSEFWAALLEKAYAKLYGNYESLHSGFTTKALQDLTGGIVQSFSLNTQDRLLTYQVLNSAVPRSTLLIASINIDTRQDNKRHTRLRNGLITRHAYSVTGLARVRGQLGDTHLVRLRNPWGKGEWNGPWSERSWEWDSLSERDKELLSVRVRNEGEFWMAFDDFAKQFSHLDLVHIGPDDWMSESALHSKKPWRAVLARRRWRSGYNAGGSPSYIETTAMNPQFHIQIPRSSSSPTAKCHVVVSVTQQYETNPGDSKKKRRRKLHYIGFAVYEVPPHMARLTPVYVAEHPPLDVTNHSVAREVVTFFTLPPGDYIVVPQTNVPNCDGKFLLRILTDEQSNIWEVNEDNVLFRNVLVEFEESFKYSENRILLSKLINKYPLEIDATTLQKILRGHWKAYLLERPSLELCKSLLMLRDYNISGRLNLMEIPVLLHMLHFWRTAFTKYIQGSHSSKSSSFNLRLILWEAGVTVSNKVLECLVLRFAKNRIFSAEAFIIVMIRLHLAHERYHSIDTKMKGNPLSLEEMILMTIYS